MRSKASTTIRVAKGGRIVIPAEVRERVGIRIGDQLVISVEDDHVMLTNLKASIQHAQQLVAKYIPPGTSLSEELMAERRKEAARE